MSVCASFHGVVGVCIETESAAAREFFAAEYAPHRVETLPAEMLQVRLRFRQGRGLSAPPGYAFHVHKGLARWAYRLRFDEWGVGIDVVGNRTAIPMVHHMMVHPSLRYLAARQGVLMLHAGAVTHAGQSVILTGHGGAGKTTTTSLLLDAGGSDWGLHADDYVFLAEGPSSLAYLTRAHLYRSLLRWVPAVADRLSMGERVRLEFFGRVRSWSGERLKWPVRVDLRRLWPGRAVHMQARPAALAVLKRADISAPQIVPLDESTFPLEALLEMNFHEARHFIRLVRKGGVLSDVEAWLTEWRARERELLRARSAQIPCLELKLPARALSVEEARRQVWESLGGLAR